ncbi:hypothetical protein [Pseudoalteromonas luteoviolacea]|uniref:hypothetical protein n=1 Tax=Pseudoalteromonas luteoviolacea TaxID=43657 RepID=UPI001B38186E|nr:hypothetical protein [Pseudoalteromonas luteoviolacea]MBQ4839855.1 hypothetical protein [Pseudoalteromonas luteoviolacea]
MTVLQSFKRWWGEMVRPYDEDGFTASGKDMPTLFDIERHFGSTKNTKFKVSPRASKAFRRMADHTHHNAVVLLGSPASNRYTGIRPSPLSNNHVRKHR